MCKHFSCEVYSTSSWRVISRRKFKSIVHLNSPICSRIAIHRDDLGPEFDIVETIYRTWRRIPGARSTVSPGIWDMSLFIEKLSRGTRSFFSLPPFNTVNCYKSSKRIAKSARARTWHRTNGIVSLDKLQWKLPLYTCNELKSPFWLWDALKNGKMLKLQRFLFVETSKIDWGM